MKINYNWLKRYVPELPEADKLEDIFTYHLCEVESVEKNGDDTLFDINILPNRAHDLLSHQGVARELAGQLGLSFNDPNKFIIPESSATKLEIQIATENCRRYSASIVRGVTVGPSPEWMKASLESIGQRSINNIVDATNLVMFDCGQPTHAFDLKKLSENKIVIRQAKEGEKMTTLDGKLVETKDSDMVIADSVAVLALAGVKGGTMAEVDDLTTEIVLEVANFDPVSVRKTARKNGILTDSAKRFENDLSPELVPEAMKKLSSLIAKMCPEAVFEDVVDVYPKKQEEREVSFSLERINKLLGANISDAQAETILKNYGYEYSKEGDRFTLAVPALRLDITGEHDMAEELGRVLGYEKISPEIPKIQFTPKINETHLREQVARQKLLAEGYGEVMTYTFVKKGKVEVARGAKGKEFLRTNLSDGLKQSYELNRLNGPLLGISEAKIFEIGTVFPENEKPARHADTGHVGGEEVHVAYADKKGVVESTLEEFTRELSLQATNNILPTSATSFTLWSPYPFITRDIAMWVPEATEKDVIIKILKENAGEFLAREPLLFDQFTKEGRTSVAFRLVFQSSKRTLTDDEISGAMQKITESVLGKGWSVR